MSATAAHPSLSASPRHRFEAASLRRRFEALTARQQAAVMAYREALNIDASWMEAVLAALDAADLKRDNP